MDVSAIALTPAFGATPPLGAVPAGEATPAEEARPADGSSSQNGEATATREAGENQPAVSPAEASRIEESQAPKETRAADDNPQTAEEKPAGIRELTPEEKQRVAELRARDVAVRQHERAHLAAAGGLVRSGAQFDFVTGPDGRQYAVGGEVQLDTAPVPDDPQATIQKAQTIRRAALAPAQPSSQDQRVAAQATRMEFAARTELSRENAEEAQKRLEGSSEVANVFAGQGPEQPRLVDVFT